MTTDQEWITFLEEKHKIKKEVWQKHKLHFDEKYLYIDSYDPSGRLISTKRRIEPTSNEQNKYLYEPGASTELWPYMSLSSLNTHHREWVFTEGELDQLTLESYNIPAITSGSTTSFKPKFTDQFQYFEVHLCYDNDKAGKTGAERVAQIFLKAGVDVDIIDLPEMEDGKDVGDFFRLGHTKEEFEELIKNARKPILQQDNNSNRTEAPQIILQPLLTTPLTYAEVESKITTYLPSSQIGLRIVLAVAVSCVFPNQVMLWLLLVGVPSSGKTDLVRLVKSSNVTYYLDNLTQNAFISGERASEDNKVYDLLPLLNKKCLVIKDWTSIFSLDEKMTKKLLGDLVGIYTSPP